jgi:hypothetical protein
MHEYLHLMHDPSHWMFELSTDLIIGLMLVKPFNWLVKRHDRKHHSVHR